MMTAAAEDKLLSELRDSDPLDLGRRILGPSWTPQQKMPVPQATDIVELLAPSLVDQLGYDGTRGNTTRGRQSGFWWKTPETGWQPIEISAAAKAIDAVLRSALVEAITARDALDPEGMQYLQPMGLDPFKPADYSEIKRLGDLRDAHDERVQAAELQVELIEVVRKFVTGGGNYRGQLVAALRDSHEFDLDIDAVIEIARSYLKLAGPAGRVQIAGLARSVLSP
jgi:hypothetical protein